VDGKNRSGKNRVVQDAMQVEVISWKARMMRKEQWDGRDGVGAGGAVYIAEST
jgi:hypothetical protein